MALSKNNEFLAAILTLAEDYGLDQNTVMEVIKQAYLTAYKKEIRDQYKKDDTTADEDLTHYEVEMDNDTGDCSILADKKVVSLVTDPTTQILESQAKLIDPRLREGDHIQIDVTPENFGRIAAQAAKQRIMQGLRDAVRDLMIEKYQDKVGKIISGIIQRRDPEYVRVEVDRAEGIMPLSEQIPGEMYRSAERKRFLLLRLTNTATDKRMVLSRASADFLKALFEMEVPEVGTGSVEIMNIAREAGSRSKVAVASTHEKVDAIGACVGPRGTRIDTIMSEVNPEKVDIILWDKDIRNFIINSLSPAKVADIKVDTETQHARVLVAEDMLSLAIGKDGQNVRLAAKLTGYKIDITSNKEDFDADVKVEDTNTETESSEPKEEKKSKSTKSKAKKEVVESEEVTIDSIKKGLTARQNKLFEENNINSLEDLEKVLSGETEVKQFTKKDLEKFNKLAGK